MQKTLSLALLTTAILTSGVTVRCKVWCNFKKSPAGYTPELPDREHTGTVEECITFIDAWRNEIKSDPLLVCVRGEFTQDLRPGVITTPFLNYTIFSESSDKNGEHLVDFEVTPRYYNILTPEEDRQAEEIAARVLSQDRERIAGEVPCI